MSESRESLADTSALTSSNVVIVCLSASLEALCVHLIDADCVQNLVVVEALAWAWVLLQGHEGEGSLAAGPHRGEDRSLEARAVPV